MGNTSASVPEKICPACGYRMDAATNAFGAPIHPREGDFSVCMKCALCMRFGRGLKLRAATEAEVLTLDLETQRELATVTRAILVMNRRRQGN